MTENNAAQPGLNDTIRAVFLEHGFTIKHGQTDLKPYVYEAVHALLSKLRAAGEPVGELRIGVSVTGQGATVCIMQPHSDGSVSAIYSETHPVGDSLGRAALASAPLADTLPLEKALHELVDKIAPGLDTGDLVQDARRASTLLGVIMASAPVAGDAQPSDAEVMKVYAETVAEYADGRGFEAGTVAFARSLLRRYAAPQASEAAPFSPDWANYRQGLEDGKAGASEAVRQAITGCGSKVIKALAAIAKADGPDTRKADDPELIYRSPVMDEVVRIRQAYDELEVALKTQADKDGGDCAKGAGDGQQKYWLCCGSTEPEHRNRRAPDCFNAARAKWGTADQHSVVKQSLTATQTGEKGESDAG